MDSCDLVAQTALPEKCVQKKKKKRMVAELSEDELVVLPDMTSSKDRMFSDNAQLASDVACLDLKNFSRMKDNGLPNSALQQTSDCLLRFDGKAPVGTLPTEL